MLKLKKIIIFLIFCVSLFSVLCFSSFAFDNYYLPTSMHFTATSVYGIPNVNRVINNSDYLMPSISLGGDFVFFNYDRNTDVFSISFRNSNGIGVGKQLNFDSSLIYSPDSIYIPVFYSATSFTVSNYTYGMYYIYYLSTDGSEKTFSVSAGALNADIGYVDLPSDYCGFYRYTFVSLSSSSVYAMYATFSDSAIDPPSSGGGTVPTGTLTIDEFGTFDVSQYAYVTIQPDADQYQYNTVIASNGSKSISLPSSSGSSIYSGVSFSVSVPDVGTVPTGTLTIDEFGTFDCSEYANVTIQPYFDHFYQYNTVISSNGNKSISLPYSPGSAIYPSVSFSVAVPDVGIVPTGTLTIDELGTFDCSQYSSVIVQTNDESFSDFSVLSNGNYLISPFTSQNKIFNDYPVLVNVPTTIVESSYNPITSAFDTVGQFFNIEIAPDFTLGSVIGLLTAFVVIMFVIKTFIK